ncbi:MAG: hypothetical protein IT429_18215 [Gemmataceae bacterium]|nr:hypothetical protein [Gemmataceae bacterium]
MALTERTRRKPFWHLLAALLGLTGLTAAGVGLFLWFVLGEAEVGRWTALVGAGLAVPAVLVVLVQTLLVIFSRRGAVSLNVAVQVVLAAAIVGGANLYAYLHPARWDLTWDQQFTIQDEVRTQLARLRDDTTIVLHLRHVTFGQGKDYTPDAYDAAAARVVQDRVRDLVEQFQQLGPRFKVVALDVKGQDYQDRMKVLQKDAPALHRAIKESSENSVFFYTRDGAAGKKGPLATDAGKVQRISFSQLYRLDRNASKDRGNLVLRPQGVEPFARRILNIDARRPRVAVAVIHGVLGLESNREVIGMSGLKQVLRTRGYDARDIIIKKPNEATGTWEPAALTYADYRYEELEEEVAELDELIADQKRVVEAIRQKVNQVVKFWEDSLAQINKEIALLDLGDGRRVRPLSREDVEEARRRKLTVRDVTDADRKEFIADARRALAAEEEELAERRRIRSQRAGEMSGLDVENLQELRRIADVEAKLKRLLSEVDLLIVPRFTLYNIPRRDLIPPWLHGLQREQVEVVKGFLKAGRPVLFCLGPTNEDPADPRVRRPPNIKPDELEPLLEEMGFKLPPQTVLFDAETQPTHERRPAFLVREPEVKVPVVSFDWPAASERVHFRKGQQLALPGKLRASLRLSVPGADQDSELRLRHPRPIYYDPPGGKPSIDPVFLMTNATARSWNESQPYPSAKRVPRYEPPKDTDPDRGTVREPRRGPFPIGVAAEVPVPRSWYADPDRAEPATARVAVIGHGAVFSGESLSPAREQLFLDVSNWLLGRDELLAKASEPWQYPRVRLDATEETLWRWGTLAGMPLLFVYLGCMMWLVRRLR